MRARRIDRAGGGGQGARVVGDTGQGGLGEHVPGHPAGVVGGERVRQHHADVLTHGPEPFVAQTGHQPGQVGAGQGLRAGVEQIALDDFRAVLELNLVAPLALMQAVLPAMRRQGAGSIINVSSGTTFADVPGTGGYVASKIALERLSAIARNELDGTGSAVSTIIPFATSTEFLTSIRAGRAEAEAMTAGGFSIDAGRSGRRPG